MKEDKKEKKNKAKQKFTKKSFYIIGCISIAVIGTILVLSYMFSMNMAIGAPGVLMLAAGAFGAWYFWKGAGDFVTTSFGLDKPEIVEANSLVLKKSGYADFMNIYEPLGVPRRCRRDKHFYYVMEDWSDNEKLKLREFKLPDEIIFDPTVFAERVIELPAHRKIFSRREGMGQYIKTGLLLVAMLIIGIVMIATTGGG